MSSLTENLKKAPGKLKLAIPVIGVTGLVQLIGMSTNYWIKAEDRGFTYSSGLWKTCSCFHTCICGSFDSIFGWVHTVRACEVIGFLGVGACFLLTAGLIFKPSNVLKVLAVLCIIGSGILILIGVIVYASEVDYDLHYSFGLCCVAVALCGVVFVLLLMARLDVSPTGASVAYQRPADQQQTGGYLVRAAPVFNESPQNA